MLVKSPSHSQATKKEEKENRKMKIALFYSNKKPSLTKNNWKLLIECKLVLVSESIFYNKYFSIFLHSRIPTYTIIRYVLVPKHR